MSASEVAIAAGQLDVDEVLERVAREDLCGACGQPFTAASCRAVAVIASRRGRGG